MSRKDTIIISVLINAGLLAVLFATAWNTHDLPRTDAKSSNSVFVQAENVHSIPIPVAPQQGSLAVVEDKTEIDSVLKRYAAAQQSRAASRQLEAEAPAKSEIKNVVAVQPLKNDQAILITVKRGDYLDKIARSNGCSVDKIMALNGLTNTRLQIGQQLKVPPASEQISAPVKAQVSENTSYYVVQSGDSPWMIARKHNVDISDLLKLNNLDEERAKSINIGDRLRVR